MATDKGGQRGLSDHARALRDRISGRTLLLVVAGFIAGSSLTVLGNDTVLVPVFGSVPGFLLGTVGLLVAFGVYQQVGCCDDCNQTTIGLGSGCGCDDDCGDSCSYNP